MDFQTLLQRGCEQERQPHLPRRRKYIICMMRPELEVGQQKGRQAGLQPKKKCCLMESARINTARVRKQDGPRGWRRRPRLPLPPLTTRDESERAPRGDGGERRGGQGGRKEEREGEKDCFAPVCGCQVQLPSSKVI